MSLSNEENIICILSNDIWQYLTYYFLTCREIAALRASCKKMHDNVGLIRAFNDKVANQSVSLVARAVHFFLLPSNEIYSTAHKLELEDQPDYRQIAAKLSPKKYLYFDEKNIRINQIVDSYHVAYFLTSFGDVYAYGAGYYGGLGNGSRKFTDEPIKIIFSADKPIKINKIAPYKKRCVFLSECGQAYILGCKLGEIVSKNYYCWSTPENLNLTLDVNAIITDVCQDAKNLILLTQSGRVLGIGINKKGQLGLPDCSQSSQLSYLDYFRDIKISRVINCSILRSSFCFITDKGSVYFTGSIYHWLPGLEELPYFPPTQIPGIDLLSSPIKKIQDPYILTMDGAVYCRSDLSIQSHREPEHENPKLKRIQFDARKSILIADMDQYFADETLGSKGSIIYEFLSHCGQVFSIQHYNDRVELTLRQFPSNLSIKRIHSLKVYGLAYEGNDGSLMMDMNSNIWTQPVLEICHAPELIRTICRFRDFKFANRAVTTVDLPDLNRNEKLLLELKNKHTKMIYNSLRKKHRAQSSVNGSRNFFILYHSKRAVALAHALRKAKTVEDYQNILATQMAYYDTKSKRDSDVHRFVCLPNYLGKKLIQILSAPFTVPKVKGVKGYFALLSKIIEDLSLQQDPQRGRDFRVT